MEYECMESGVILSFYELFFLLQSAGINTINGFFMDVAQISEEETIQLAASLERKGILSAKDTAFEMERSVEKMIRCMGWPDRDFLAEKEYEMFYCYEREEMVLVTRLYPARKNALELILYTKEQFQKEFEKQEDE